MQFLIIWWSCSGIDREYKQNKEAGITTSRTHKNTKWGNYKNQKWTTKIKALIILRKIKIKGSKNKKKIME